MIVAETSYAKSVMIAKKTASLKVYEQPIMYEQHLLEQSKTKLNGKTWMNSIVSRDKHFATHHLTSCSSKSVLTNVEYWYRSQFLWTFMILASSHLPNWCLDLVSLDWKMRKFSWVWKNVLVELECICQKQIIKNVSHGDHIRTTNPGTMRP